MVNVGSLKRVTLYVYLPDMSAYLDCSNRMMTYSLKQRRNVLDSFEAKIAGITGANRQYFRKNCIALLYVGLRDEDDPTARIVLEEPKFNEDYTVDVSGFQSSGTLDTTPYRRLHTTSTTKTSYVETATSTVLAAICSGIITVDGSDTGGLLSVSMNLNYENSLKEVKRLADLSAQEWWITHTKTVDTIHMAATKGRTVSSQITFNQSGAGRNIWAMEAEDEVKTNCNDAIILGSGSGMTQMMTEIYEASGIYGQLNLALDTRLAEDVSTTETSIDVKHTQTATQMPASNFYVKIDSEIMNVSSYTGTTLTVTRAAESTTAASHANGTDVIWWRENTGGAGSQIDIDVDNITGDPSSTTQIRIGSEIINVSSYAAGTFNNCTRGSDSTTPYFHGNDIYAFVYDEGAGNYTPSSPKAGSLISTNGLFTRSYQNNSATGKNELDRLGQDLVITTHQLMPRLSVSPIDIFDVLDTNANAPIVVGDLVTVQDDLDNIDLDQGGSASATYRIYSLTFTYDYGKMKLEYDLENQRLTYSEEVSEGIGIDYQRPTREFAENLGSYFKIDTSGQIKIDSDYGDVEIEAADDIILDADDDINCYPDDDFLIKFSSNTSADGFYIKNNSGSTLFSVLGDGTITGIPATWDRKTSPNRLEAHTPGDRVRLFNATETTYADIYHDGNTHIATGSGDLYLHPGGGDVCPGTSFGTDLGIVDTNVWNWLYVDDIHAEGGISCDNISADLVSAATVSCVNLTYGSSDPPIKIGDVLFATRIQEGTSTMVDYCNIFTTNSNGSFVFSLDKDKWSENTEEWLFVQIVKDIVPIACPHKLTTVCVSIDLNKITIQTGEANVPFSLLLKGLRIDSVRDDISNPYPQIIDSALDVEQKKVMFKHPDGVWREDKPSKKIKRDYIHQKRLKEKELEKKVTSLKNTTNENIRNEGEGVFSGRTAGRADQPFSVGNPAYHAGLQHADGFCRHERSADRPRNRGARNSADVPEVP